MSKILEDLYEGKVYPAEQYTPIMDYHKQLRKEHQQHYNDFKQKIDNSLIEEFENILCEQISIISMELSEMFVYGFKTGAKMMMEILQEDTK